MSNYTVSGNDSNGDLLSVDCDDVDQAIDLSYWMDINDYDNIDMKDTSN